MLLFPWPIAIKFDFEIQGLKCQDISDATTLFIFNFQAFVSLFLFELAF